MLRAGKIFEAQAEAGSRSPSLGFRLVPGGSGCASGAARNDADMSEGFNGPEGFNRARRFNEIVDQMGQASFTIFILSCRRRSGLWSGIDAGAVRLGAG